MGKRKQRPKEFSFAAIVACAQTEYVVIAPIWPHCEECYIFLDGFRFIEFEPGPNGEAIEAVLPMSLFFCKWRIVPAKEITISTPLLEEYIRVYRETEAEFERIAREAEEKEKQLVDERISAMRALREVQGPNGSFIVR